MAKYLWKFECNNFLKTHPERVTRIETELEKVRKIRDKAMSTRKQTEIKLIESGKMSGLIGGFASIGSQIMGNTFGSNAYATQTSRTVAGPGPNTTAGDGGGGFFVTQESEYYDTRTEAGLKKKRVHDLIDKGKRFVLMNQERKL